MTQAAAFRGQPLLVFAGVLCAWVGLRVALWQPFSDLGLPEMRGVVGRPVSIAAERMTSLAPSRRSSAPIELLRSVSAGTRPLPGVLPVTLTGPPLRGFAAPGRSAASTGIGRGPVELAVGHNLLLAGGLSRIELSPSLAAYLGSARPLAAGVPAAAPFVVAVPQPALSSLAPRLSADAWLMVRQDTTSSVVSGRPSYGRSQAGGVVRYRLARSSPHGPQAYLRASSALQGAREKDLAAGLSARPVPGVPLRFAAEARIGETGAGTELRPAVIAVTEFLPLGLPLGGRAEAYVQGGYVAGRFATAFVDGQGRIERPIARFARAEITVGAGVWGGAQKGAGRLDIGPAAAVSFRLGETRGRVAADYRFRIAGDAEPRSGPALTLSAGF